MGDSMKCPGCKKEMYKDVLFEGALYDENDCVYCTTKTCVWFGIRRHYHFLRGEQREDV